MRFKKKKSPEQTIIGRKVPLTSYGSYSATLYKRKPGELTELDNPQDPNTTEYEQTFLLGLIAMLLVSQDADLEAVARDVAQPVKLGMQQRAWASVVERNRNYLLRFRF
jgi:hypothetical protein